jgi:hypothetical protein
VAAEETIFPSTGWGRLCRRLQGSEDPEVRALRGMWVFRDLLKSCLEWKSVVISVSANSIDVVEMTVVAAFQSVKVDLSVTVDLEILASQRDLR